MSEWKIGAKRIKKIARRMGGAKRYPSSGVGEDDGFREGLNHPTDFIPASDGHTLSGAKGFALGRLAPRDRA